MPSSSALFRECSIEIKVVESGGCVKRPVLPCRNCCRLKAGLSDRSKVLKHKQLFLHRKGQQYRKLRCAD